MSVVPDYTNSWTGQDIGGLLRVLPKDIEAFRFDFSHGSKFNQTIEPISTLLPSWRVNTNTSAVCQQMRKGPLDDDLIENLVKVFDTNVIGLEDIYINYKDGAIKIDVGRRNITLYGNITKPSYKECKKAIPNILSYNVEP